MTIVNSWNEWDPLKHVIVGAVENANIPPMEPATKRQNVPIAISFIKGHVALRENQGIRLFKATKSWNPTTINLLQK